MKAAALEGDDQRKPSKPRSAASMGGFAGVGQWPSRTKEFLQDVRTETKRVTWPSFKQIQATTVVVVLTVFFFGVYFGILDWAFNNIVRRLLRLGG